jgi:hypothetical protein
MSLPSGRPNSSGRYLTARQGEERSGTVVSVHMRRSTLFLFALLLAGSLAATALAQSWQRNPDARRFARPGAAEVTLVLRNGGMGGACGGGGCTAGVEIRSVSGTLPSRDLSYYYSDRPDPNPGCIGPNRETLLEHWTEVVAAPIRGSAARRPSCGILVMNGDTPTYWVILRVRPAPANP